MALSTSLPVHKVAYDLLSLATDVVRNMPRICRARAANRPSHREHALDTVGYMALMERCGWIDPK